MVSTLNQVRQLAPARQKKARARSPLDAAVLQAIEPGRRVAILVRWSSVATALEARGCTVREVLPAVGAVSGTVELALADFEPETVVIPEGLSASEVDAMLQALGRTKVKPVQLVIAFRNSSSASLILSSLMGDPTPPGGLPDHWVRQRLAAAGYLVRERVVPQGPPRAPGLSPATERELRTLLAQLNPDSTSDEVVYVAQSDPQSGAAQRKPTATRPFSPNTVSVIIRNHSLARLEQLDQAVFSLACQQHRDLEIVVVTQSREPRAASRIAEVLKRHKALGGYSYQVVSRPSDTDIRAHLANAGVAAARGRYIAFLDDDDVVYPDHYARLVGALRSSEAAWAFAPVRRAWFGRDSQGEVYCERKDLFPGSDRWDFASLLRENFITCHAYVVDRERTGAFHIAFAEELSKNEDYTFLLRLAVLFRPVCVGGKPSCEYRIRNDGSNSIMQPGLEQAVAERRHAEWQLANAVARSIKQPLQILMTVRDFEEELAKATRDLHETIARQARELAAVTQRPPELVVAAPAELRYRVADASNGVLKTRVPRVHQVAKNVLSRVLLTR